MPAPTPGTTPTPPSPTAPLQRHTVDAGTLLVWQDEGTIPLRHLPEIAHAAAVLAFAAPSAPRANGLMWLFTPSSQASPPTEPQLALLLTEPTLRRLLADAPAPASALLSSIRDSPDAPPAVLPLPTSARFAAEAIRRWPLRGLCRDLALTARTHDLILAFLGAVPPPTGTDAPPLLRGFVEQLRAAAAILDRDLENPPSLSALAARVGLSETSLKRGFPRVYGTTVFGYLRERRLVRARELLQSGAATVLETAAQVGYSNPSNFAAAFRARFGANPKAYQLAARR